MRKEAILGKNAIKGVLVTLLFFLACFNFLHNAEAGVCEDANSYEFGTQGSCTNKEAQETISLQRTGVDISTILSTEVPAIIGFNDSLDGLGTCGVVYIAESMRELGEDPTDGDGILGIFSPDEVKDAELANESLKCDHNSAMLGATTNGSLMGVTKFVSNTVLEESIPVNLAYYVKHTASKIPVINQTAYAQGVSYNALGLEFVLGVWEKTRNVAYAMMSVIMLVVGILITTQKKINPQTVVTVQSAIPRVVISLFLITFSYPIGAVLASLVTPLMVMAIGFFNNARTENFANMNHLVSFVTLIVRFLGPQGAISAIIGSLVGLLSLVAMLIALVKLLFVQLKILVQIVIAPIQFAISAIPGQEHLVTDWFKNMIVKVLSIPAIMFMIALAWYWPNEFFTNPNNFSAIVTGSGPLTLGMSFFRSSVSLAFTTISIPLLQIMTLFMAIKADKSVESFILGDPKKRK